MELKIYDSFKRPPTKKESRYLYGNYMVLAWGRATNSPEITPYTEVKEKPLLYTLWAKPPTFQQACDAVEDRA